jgi:hypothetical protein
MKHIISRVLIGTAVLVLATMAAGAEEVTVQSILSAHKAGAPAAGIVAVVSDPANTVAVTTADVATLRSYRCSDTVITAIEARAPAATGVQPDDASLVDLV